jgi:hypothetical protein
MAWQPGQSGNPNGYAGPRVRRRNKVFDIIQGLNHKDALEVLSTLANHSQDEGIKVGAAAALAPYCHPKLQATPVPRFIENPIDTPDFTSVEVAEGFLAKIPVLVARGQLDFQSALELSSMAKLWIDTQYERKGHDLKVVNAVGGPPEQTIRIEGGLPSLPGTNVTMPTINGHVADAHALAAPHDVVADPCEAKAIGPHALQPHHFTDAVLPNDPTKAE